MEWILGVEPPGVLGAFLGGAVLLTPRLGAGLLP